MQVAQSVSELVHGVVWGALLIPSMSVADIDMEAFAGMFIAQCSIVMDARACDAPPIISVSARSVENSRRMFLNRNMLGRYSPLA
jgi:hypothetical protein